MANQIDKIVDDIFKKIKNRYKAEIAVLSEAQFRDIVKALIFNPDQVKKLEKLTSFKPTLTKIKKDVEKQMSIQLKKG